MSGSRIAKLFSRNFVVGETGTVEMGRLEEAPKEGAVSCVITPFESLCKV